MIKTILGLAAAATIALAASPAMADHEEHIHSADCGHDVSSYDATYDAYDSYQSVPSYQQTYQTAPVYQQPYQQPYVAPQPAPVAPVYDAYSCYSTTGCTPPPVVVAKPYHRRWNRPVYYQRPVYRPVYQQPAYIQRPVRRYYATSHASFAPVLQFRVKLGF
jgi:hypothetical protein